MHAPFSACVVITGDSGGGLGLASLAKGYSGSPQSSSDYFGVTGNASKRRRDACRATGATVSSAT